jgi:hypothetical protein
MAPADCTKTALEGPMENIPAAASPASGSCFARGREWVHKPKTSSIVPSSVAITPFRPGETPLEVPNYSLSARPRFERLRTFSRVGVPASLSGFAEADGKSPGPEEDLRDLPALD